MLFLLPYSVFHFRFLVYFVIFFCTFSWASSCFILFIYFFQTVLNYCHFPSSFYPPTFDLVLLSRLLPLSSISDHYLTLVFLVFALFVFSSSYHPSPIFYCMLSASVLFSYSSLFCPIICLFPICFLFIILLFLLSFLICIWSPILISFRFRINGLSLRTPSPWSNDRFLWLRWWMLCCLLSAFSNSESRALL